MTPSPRFPLIPPLPPGVHAGWGWLLALGILLLAVGALATGAAVLTTLVTMLLFGWLLLFTGLFQVASAIRHRDGGHFWLHLLSGVLDGAIGLVLLFRPGAGAAAFALLLAAYFFVGGIFRGAAATSLRLPGRGWSILAAVVDLVLAALLVAGWPETGLWVIGLFVGINLIMQGATWVMVALALRTLAGPG